MDPLKHINKTIYRANKLKTMEIEDFPHLVGYNEDPEDYLEESPAQKQQTTPTQDLSTKTPRQILSLNTTLGSDSIQLSKTTKTKIPLMVSVNENTLSEETTADASIDLVCLIDTSGSMDGHKLAEVQKSLVYMVELMSENDRMALVSFNSEAQVLNSLRICSIENKRGRLRSNISNLQAMGGTNIVGGLNKALKILEHRESRSRVASVFLLSDGNDNFGLQGLDFVLKKFSEKIGHFSIHTFGYGDDHDSELMTRLAENRGGSFYYIEDLNRVDEAFIDCLALLKSSLGLRLSARVELIPPEIYPNLRFAVEGTVKSSQFRLVEEKTNKDGAGTGEDGQPRGQTMEVVIEDIYIGIKKNFICELEFDAVPNPSDYDEDEVVGVEIAKVHFEVSSTSLPPPKNSLEGGQEQQGGEIVKKICTSCEDLIFVNIIPEGVDHPIQRSEEVEKELMRLQGAEIMKEARAFIDQDRIEEAKKMFEGFDVKLSRFKSIDSVLQNLQNDCQVVKKYIYRPVRNNFGRKRMGHLMAQRAHNYRNMTSNPIWSQQGMYENKRQKKMKKMLFAMK